MGATVKACAVLLGIVLANATASCASAPTPDPSSPTLMAANDDQECCKVCHKGKACGNSCIARDKQCHQPAGCACDG